MQTELILIRHGETAWNAERRFQGHQDSPLTPLGMAQAEVAAEQLRTYAPTALYASDLRRTLQTAQHIAIATGLTVVQEPALRERNLGIFEGLTRTESEIRYPADYARYVAREPDYVIPAGESLIQLCQRSLAIAEKLAQRHPGERIAIVSHGAFITSLLRQILGQPLHLPSTFRVHNGSLSRILYTSTAASWALLSLGETLHPNGSTQSQ
jgi:2,3-bisphosphoglycerate-dependent phosphoglycerate mutase